MREQQQRRRTRESGFSKFTHGWSSIFFLANIVFAGILLYSDLLSKRNLIILLGIMGLIFLLIFPPLYSKRFKVSRKIIAFILSIAIGAGYLMGSFYVLSTLGFLNNVTKGMGVEIVKRVNVLDKPFNVYITGLDTFGEIDEDARSDVNMIATVNPMTKHVLLTSIPRDCYVELPDHPDAFDKLTHTGHNGPGTTVAAVEELLDIHINYYVKVNYSTVVELVDAIDGIDVFSDYEFSTHNQDWYYFSYGDNHLDGGAALAFARERQAFEDGDFQRNKNQAKVMAGIIRKAASSSTILTRYTAILEGIAPYIEMNMSQNEIKALVRMQQDDMAGWTVESQNIVGYVDYLPCYALDDDYASVVVPEEESIAEALAFINEVMDERPQ